VRDRRDGCARCAGASGTLLALAARDGTNSLQFVHTRRFPLSPGARAMPRQSTTRRSGRAPARRPARSSSLSSATWSQCTRRERLRAPRLLRNPPPPPAPPRASRTFALAASPKLVPDLLLPPPARSVQRGARRRVRPRRGLGPDPSWRSQIRTRRVHMGASPIPANVTDLLLVPRGRATRDVCACFCPLSGLRPLQ
jgi:hypothetical protein